ncbi:MAG TPA: site-2 protease family protein [Acidimicrobiales bacterium]|nr:site-2 protease family protein [Acidimicrobiales bacterium]
MAFGGYGGGNRRPQRPLAGNERTAIIVVVAAALVVILLRTHRLTRFEIIYFLVLIPSIILHEISHGVVALAFGDDTAKRMGRLNLNPIRHIDPIGTLLVPAVLSLSGLGAYGWAKPVPVSTNRLRSPRNQTVLVSLVGPLTNIVLAAVFGLAFVLTTPLDVRQIIADVGGLAQSSTGQYYPPTLLGQVLFIGGIANLVLAIFNLIPCPPLDGAAVLERFIPVRMLPDYYRLQPVLIFLPFILILLFRNQWGELLGHLFNWWSHLLA